MFCLGGFWQGGFLSRGFLSRGLCLGGFVWGVFVLEPSLIVVYILELANKMFQYNPNANYLPNGGQYLQILSGKDLYKQTIVVSKNDTFPVRFLNIFVDYLLGQMHVGDKLWTNWNKAPLKLWQTQLNFAVCCASSACGVSSEHLNYTKHPMVRAVYRFHTYHHIRQVLKRLQVPLLHESSFNTSDNPFTESEFFKICKDYGIHNDPMKCRDEKFYWTYQRGTGWPND